MLAVVQASEGIAARATRSAPEFAVASLPVCAYVTTLPGPSTLRTMNVPLNDASGQLSRVTPWPTRSF
jgi:hypothetical protein